MNSSAEKANKVRVREKLAYGLGMLGTNVSYGLVTGYLMIYYTDVFIIPASVVAILMLVSKVWDAVNDPLMGIVADRTRTRWGKFRPYIFASGFILAFFTMMMFFSPNLSPGGKIAFAFVAYLGWDFAYTMSDVPKWSLSSVMSGDPKERVSIVSWGKLFGMLGNIGISIAIIPLVQLFGASATGTNYVMGYRMMAVILGIVTLAASLLMFFGTRERVVHKEEKPSFKDSMRSVFKNKPLLILLLSLLVNGLVQTVSSGLQIYYIKYNLGNENLVPIVTAVAVVPMMLGAALAAPLAHRISKKKVYLIAQGFLVLRALAQFFIGYHSAAAIIALAAVSALFGGIINVLNTAMITDTIEDSARKTGKRNEGIVFSTQSFVTKLNGALGSAAAAMVLSVVGYVQNTQQTVQTLDAIHFCMTILPAIGAVLAIVIMSFFRVEDYSAPSAGTMVDALDGSQ